MIELSESGYMEEWWKDDDIVYPSIPFINKLR
jgi:hypothetical protein